MSEAFEFTPAVRENVGLIIGLAGGTGSGKTYSAMELASGIAGGKPFAVGDTEARRALHYADRFNFHHGEIRAPFRPKSYVDAILAAEARGYPVMVIDSQSHEYAGEGGLLDWHDEILGEIVERKRALAEQKDWQFTEWKEREANTMRAWIEPKMQHKRFVQKLLQLRMHVILCFRAEEKIEIVKEDNKTVIRPKEGPTGARGWMPVCEKNLPFELTCSFLLKADRPGFPIPIKLQEQHRELFPLDRPIGRATGEAIAAWARGDQPQMSEALATVLEVIAKSQTLEQLKAVPDQLAVLRDTMTEREREHVRAALKAKSQQLKEAT